MTNPALPAWLAPVPGRPGVFAIDADQAYPATLALLEAAPAVPFDGAIDGYWLEVAAQCVKLEAQLMLAAAGLDPRPQQSLVLLVRGAKDKWASARYAPGRLAELAKHGDAQRIAAREARGYFRAARGVLPV